MAELDDETLLAFAEGEGFDELGHLMRIGTKLGLCPGVEVGIDSNKQAFIVIDGDAPSDLQIKFKECDIISPLRENEGRKRKHKPVTSPGGATIELTAPAARRAKVRLQPVDRSGIGGVKPPAARLEALWLQSTDTVTTGDATHGSIGTEQGKPMAREVITKTFGIENADFEVRARPLREAREGRGGERAGRGGERAMRHRPSPHTRAFSHSDGSRPSTSLTTCSTTSATTTTCCSRSTRPSCSDDSSRSRSRLLARWSGARARR